MNNKNNSKDNGYTSILYAIGTKPLQNWDFSVKNGHIKRILDADIQSPSIEIIGANVDSNYIYIPQLYLYSTRSKKIIRNKNAYNSFINKKFTKIF